MFLYSSILYRSMEQQNTRSTKQFTGNCTYSTHVYHTHTHRPPVHTGQSHRRPPPSHPTFSAFLTLLIIALPLLDVYLILLRVNRLQNDTGICFPRHSHCHRMHHMGSLPLACTLPVCTVQGHLKWLAFPIHEHISRITYIITKKGQVTPSNRIVIWPLRSAVHVTDGWTFRMYKVCILVHLHTDHIMPPCQMRWMVCNPHHKTASPSIHLVALKQLRPRYRYFHWYGVYLPCSSLIMV